LHSATLCVVYVLVQLLHVIFRASYHSDEHSQRRYDQTRLDCLCQISLVSHQLCRQRVTLFIPPCGPGGNTPYPITSPPSTPSFSSFYFSLSYSLHLFCFFVPSHSTRIVPLRLQAGCRRRRLNLALVFLYVDFVLYVFLIKHASLFLLYFVSDIGMFVLKGDVKLQLTVNVMMSVHRK